MAEGCCKDRLKSRFGLRLKRNVSTVSDFYAGNIRNRDASPKKL